MLLYEQKAQAKVVVLVDFHMGPAEANFTFKFTAVLCLHDCQSLEQNSLSQELLPALRVSPRL